MLFVCFSSMFACTTLNGAQAVHHLAHSPHRGTTQVIAHLKGWSMKFFCSLHIVYCPDTYIGKSHPCAQYDRRIKVPISASHFYLCLCPGHASFIASTVLQIRLTIKYFVSTDICKKQAGKWKSNSDLCFQTIFRQRACTRKEGRTKQSKRAKKEGGPTKKEEEEVAKRDEREKGCLSWKGLG